MSDEEKDQTVEIPFGEKANEQATLLLAAAEELDLDPSVVRTGEGTFVVPTEVADKAGLSPDDDDKDESKRTAKKSAKK
jgi:hypothetical protein